MRVRMCDCELYNDSHTKSCKFISQKGKSRLNKKKKKNNLKKITFCSFDSSNAFKSNKKLCFPFKKNASNISISTDTNPADSA